MKYTVVVTQGTFRYYEVEAETADDAERLVKAGDAGFPVDEDYTRALYKVMPVK